MKTYITNNCANLHFYFEEAREYDNPIVGCLFVNDEDYIKFCSRFLHFMTVEPVFGSPKKDSKWAEQNNGEWYKHKEIRIPYPVMFLEEIEIHWIHEESQEAVLDKFLRRRERFWTTKPTPVFMLSCSDLCNDHSPEDRRTLISAFLQIDTAIYVTREITDMLDNRKAEMEGRIEVMDCWKNENTGRDSHHIPLIHHIGNKFDVYKKIMKRMGWKINKQPIVQIRSLPSSKSVPINNSYIVENTVEDMHIVIYYNTEHSCKIILRRLDEDSGWSKPIFIKIGNDCITVPSCQDNYLEYDTITREFLQPSKLDYEQKIPKTIIQTLETNVCDNVLQYNTMMTFIELNPEYEYKFYGNQERRNFIKKFFDSKTLDAYDTLVPGAYKADLFRYCYLYIHGGCYFDFKMILRKPLRKIIKATDSFIVCSDYDRNNTMDKKYGTSYLNSLIFTVKNNHALKLMIEKCVENILEKQDYFLQSINYRGFTDILDLTGPTLFYKVIHDKISDENIRFKHLILNNDESNYKNFVVVDFENGETVCTKTYTTTVSPFHYSKLWEKGELFYKNKRVVDKYTIYVYPHPFQDIFEFALNSRILTVSRVEAWGLDLYIKIIDNESSETVNLKIGRNGSTKKLVLLESSMFVGNENLENVMLENTVKPENINVTDIVIAITSVIHVSSNPMGHNEKRSLVSPSDRFTQTIEQIYMVKQLVPNATIILLESSKNMPSAELKELANLCHYVILYNSPTTNLYNHTHPNKSLGEIWSMVHLGNIIQDKDFKWFCKLNGRWKFRDNFSIQKFLCPYPTANCIKGNGRLGILAQTVFYCVPKRYYKLYKEHFNSWLDPETTEPVEHIFTMFLECVRTINTVSSLDIEGIGAAHGLHMIL